MSTSARDLADQYWEYRLDHRHFANLSRGDLSRLEQWDDLSKDGIEASRQVFLQFAAQASSQSGSATGADRTLAETLSAVAFMDATVGVWWPQLRAPSRQSGLLSILVPGLHLQPLANADHGRRYLEKLRKFRTMVDQLADQLVEGAATGIVPIVLHARQGIDQLDQVLARPASENPLTAQDPPSELSTTEATRWLNQLVETIDSHFRPALASYRDVLQRVTLPAARSADRPGLCYLPDGDQVYRDMIKGHTTLDLDPEAVHELGLDRVEMLEDEYRSIAGPLLGTRDVAEIYRSLRDDPELKYAESKDLVADAVRCLAAAGAAMNGWFGQLPKAPCVAAPIDLGAMAYYYAPTADGSRPGQFFFNVADPTAWARFQIPAITYHEGIPGHHLQIALAVENTRIHDLHRHCYLPAFGEGWGLYSERLSDEMGLYTDDWERVGMLTADSLRAGRLVVDTGIHARGWSRSKAIRFMADHSPMSIHEITEEIDRYIACPGQALSYMIGRIEIESLRAEAEQRLGSRFDIRSFHGTVLGNGAVPLRSLRRRVTEWLDRENSTNP